MKIKESGLIDLARKSFIIILLILIIILIYLLIIKTVENKNQSGNNYKILQVNGTIIIDEKDRICISDADCVLIYIKCGDCGGDAVNKDYVEKYKYNLKEACKNSSIACDWDYRPKSEIKCINNQCRFVKK